MALNLLVRVICLAIFINLVSPSKLILRQSCSTGYTFCSPPGATGSSTYDIGDGLIHLYSDILDTVNPQAPAPGTSPGSVNPNGPAKRQPSDIMCCASGLSCLLLEVAAVPMCYDKFTTDFALPDGGYGTVSNGTLVTSSSVRVNLISGEYVVPNGQTGNIYNAAPSDKPNTATLPIPTQYTSSGVGSAVLASQLGNSASYATETTFAIKVTPSVSGIVSSSALSLSGPAVTPCSTCCVECGRPSTTFNATVPTITSMPSSSGSFLNPITGTSNATITPPITVGSGVMIQITGLHHLTSIIIFIGLLTGIVTNDLLCVDIGFIAAVVFLLWEVSFNLTRG